MSDNRFFSVAGVSRKSGALKVRWANDTNRPKILAADGQTDIDLVQLPAPMSKMDAVKYLLAEGFQKDNAETQGVLNAYLTGTGVTVASNAAPSLPASDAQRMLSELTDEQRAELEASAKAEREAAEEKEKQSRSSFGERMKSVRAKAKKASEEQKVEATIEA